MEAGNNFLWKFITGRGSLNVPVDAGILHQYRVHLHKLSAGMTHVQFLSTTIQLVHLTEVCRCCKDIRTQCRRRAVDKRVCDARFPNSITQTDRVGDGRQRILV